MNTLNISQMLLISLIGFLLVLVVLAVIELVVIGISKLIQAFQKEEAPVQKPLTSSQPVMDTGVSSGSLKLIDTDEKTAAIIMAIVSDQTGIPLSRLIFKSIKLIED